MKSFRELTVAAKQSRLAGISRETQEAGTAIRHANELTEEDIHAAMADARRNLHADEDYLAARLGLAALAH